MESSVAARRSAGAAGQASAASRHPIASTVRTFSARSASSIFADAGDARCGVGIAQIAAKRVELHHAASEQVDLGLHQRAERFAQPARESGTRCATRRLPVPAVPGRVNPADGRPLDDGRIERRLRNYATNYLVI
jgi:hypothetical protein